MAKVVSIPTKLEDMKLDSEFEKIKASLDTEKQTELIQHQEKLKKLELKKRQNLHALGAAIAIAEATNQKDVEMILAESKLDEEAKRLGIYEQKEIRNQAHEIALEKARAETEALIEEKKLLVQILGKDHEKLRDIEYLINLTRGINNEIVSNGNQGLRTPQTKDAFETIINKMQQPKKTN